MDFSSLFVRDDSFAHLNAGTRTRVPLSVLEFMERERRESERNPTKAMFVGYDRLWEAQKRVSAFLGAAPEDLFFRNNVTAAFNDFLFALPALPPGEFLATGWEYAGIVGAGRQWARVHGHALRFAPLAVRRDWTKGQLIDAVLGSLGENTRVLLVSEVATGTGAILPVKEISEGARKRGVITVVDGAHAVGILPVRLDELPDVDFYGGNFHKWFLGPEGTGFGWVNPRWRDRLQWKFGGWATDKPPAFYQGFGAGDPETCRRLFPGTIDRIPFLALPEVLAFWEKHGAGRIRAEVARKRDLAAKRAEGIGWKNRSLTEPALHGPLTCFERPASWTGSDSIEIARRLFLEARVQLALPEVESVKLVRLSPGVYAGDDEIASAFERLASWKP